MRKFLLLILLASAASPAFAGPGDNDDHDRPRGHRAERQSDNDSQRPELTSARPERSSQPPQQQIEASRPDSGNSHTFRDSNVSPEPQSNATETRARKSERSTMPDRPQVQTPSTPIEARIRKPGDNPTLPDRPAVERHVQPSDSPESVRVRRGVGRDGSNDHATIEERNVRNAPNVRDADGLLQPRHDTPRVVQPTERRVSRRPVFGTEPPAPTTARSSRAHPSRRWNTDWRHDHRYDWHNWRRHHRNKFHFGFYYDPFGWDYFRYGIGWRMWPSYYGNSFWLRDPWEYRLPPAYGPYRWVRYHYDAVLVNIYTGQIADIVYDFFW